MTDNKKTFLEQAAKLYNEFFFCLADKGYNAGMTHSAKEEFFTIFIDDNCYMVTYWESSDSISYDIAVDSGNFKSVTCEEFKEALNQYE